MKGIRDGFEEWLYVRDEGLLCSRGLNAFPKGAGRGIGGGGRGMSVRPDNDCDRGCSKGVRGGDCMVYRGGSTPVDEEDEEAAGAEVEDDCCMALACQWCSEECRERGYNTEEAD